VRWRNSFVSVLTCGNGAQAAGAAGAGLRAYQVFVRQDGSLHCDPSSSRSGRHHRLSAIIGMLSALRRNPVRLPRHGYERKAQPGPNPRLGKEGGVCPYEYPADYRQFAQECMDSARAANSAAVRTQFLELAQLWLAAATEVELRQNGMREPSGSELDGAKGFTLRDDPGR
jgi:hypothetical protein